MIKFNDDFSFERDQYCWHLIESFDGKDKDGNDKRQHRTTYHASIVQICGVIIDRSCGKCQSLEEVLSLLASAKTELTEHAESLKQQVKQ
tara:strand:- start:37 stop:306 length:270 start_codon:yes stop_codon:yes gene_type:complete